MPRPTAQLASGPRGVGRAGTWLLPSWRAQTLTRGYKVGSVLVWSLLSSVVPLCWDCCPQGPHISNSGPGDLPPWGWPPAVWPVLRAAAKGQLALCCSPVSVPAPCLVPATPELFTAHKRALLNPSWTRILLSTSSDGPDSGCPGFSPPCLPPPAFPGNKGEMEGKESYFY